jgi:hypothetical protein
MKLKISKVLDVSKFLQTKTGQELRDLLEYLGEFTQQVVQAVGGKLNFEDNFVTETKVISVISGVSTVIGVSGRRIQSIQIIRSLDPQNFVITGFGWKYNNDGNLITNIIFAGNPTAVIQVEILIFY